MCFLFICLVLFPILAFLLLCPPSCRVGAGINFAKGAYVSFGTIAIVALIVGCAAFLHVLRAETHILLLPVLFLSTKQKNPSYQAPSLLY